VSARLAALVAALLAAGCGGPAGPVAVGPVEVVSSGPAVEFLDRASAFYARLAGRRFNTLATFQDAELRQYFRAESAYADWYAELADALAEFHFEKNRPLTVSVEEFLAEGPGRARVRVAIVGENALPLRFWETRIVREDRWERQDGQWWVIPGKL
jgi:hypothetical protein